jgi:hypothetical protein
MIQWLKNFFNIKPCIGTVPAPKPEVKYVDVVETISLPQGKIVDFTIEYDKEKPEVRFCCSDPKVMPPLILAPGDKATIYGISV